MIDAIPFGLSSSKPFDKLRANGAGLAADGPGRAADGSHA